MGVCTWKEILGSTTYLLGDLVIYLSNLMFLFIAESLVSSTSPHRQMFVSVLNFNEQIKSGVCGGSFM